MGLIKYIKSKLKKETTSTPVYSGPVKQGSNEQTFRSSGETKKEYSGPVRVSDNTSTFRSTGVSSGSSSNSSSGSQKYSADSISTTNPLTQKYTTNPIIQQSVSTAKIQPSKPTGPTMEAYKPLTTKQKKELSEDKYAKNYFKEASFEQKRAAGLTLGWNVGGFISPTPTGEGTIMGNVDEYQQQNFATIGEVRGYQLKQKEKPIVDIQKQTISDIENEIKPKYSSRVTETTTQEELNKINKEYQAETLSLYKERISNNPQYEKATKSYSKSYNDLKIADLELSSYDKRNETISNVKELGISLTPVGPAYFLGKGLKEIQNTGDYYEGMPGVTTTYYGSSATNKPTFELSQEGKLDLALGLGFSGVAGGTAIRSIGKEITALRLSEGLSSNSFTVAEEVSRVGDETLVRNIQIKRTPDFSQVTEIETPVFSKGNDKFIVGVSKGKSTIRVKDFFKEIQGFENPNIKIEKDITIGARGYSTNEVFLNGIRPEGIKGFTGSGYSIVDDKISRFGYSGVSKEVKDISFGYSGNIKMAKFYNSGKVTLKSDINNLFITKKLTNNVADDFFDVGGTTVKTTTKLSSPEAAVSSATVQEATKGLGNTILKSFSKPMFQIASAEPSVKSTSAYIGTGLYELTDAQDNIYKNFGISNTKNLLELKTSNKNQQKVTQSIAQVGKIKLNNKYKQNVAEIPNVAQLMGIKTVTRQKQITTLKPGTFSPIYGINAPVNYGGDFGFKPVGGIPKFSFFDYGTKRYGKGKGIKGKYTPNISSIALNIKAPKIPKLYSKGLGALTIRPIIQPTKKKRKKKSITK